ncbi:MAG: hypothetical protein KF715_06270 [Candidatus Didemnitutus sp.]|nr:hypothetical protein [Candidatus Didemnitutus sp.]
MERYEEARVNAMAVLVALIEGKTDTILAARKLSSLRRALAGNEFDDDWRTFTCIDSETDHLPVGEERKQWAADALAAKDVEIQHTEDRYRDPALAAACNLLRRYREPTQSR